MAFQYLSEEEKKRREQQGTAANSPGNSAGGSAVKTAFERILQNIGRETYQQARQRYAQGQTTQSRQTGMSNTNRSAGNAQTGRRETYAEAKARYGLGTPQNQTQNTARTNTASAASSRATGRKQEPTKLDLTLKTLASTMDPSRIVSLAAISAAKQEAASADEQALRNALSSQAQKKQTPTGTVPDQYKRYAAGGTADEQALRNALSSQTQKKQTPTGTVPDQYKRYAAGGTAEPQSSTSVPAADTSLMNMTDEELEAENERRKQQFQSDRLKRIALTLGTGGLYDLALAVQNGGKKLGIFKEDGGITNLYKQSEQSNQAYKESDDLLKQRQAQSYNEVTQNTDFADKSKTNKDYYRNDSTYRYINDSASRRGQGQIYENADEQEAALWKGIFADNNYQNVAHMTDEQRAIYNYLYDPNDPSKSLEYIKSIMPELNAKNMEALQKERSEYAGRNAGTAALSTLATILETPVRSVAGVQALGDYAKSLFTGENIDTNNWYFNANKTKAATTQAVLDQITEASKNAKIAGIDEHGFADGTEKDASKTADVIGSMLYQAVLSSGENLVNMGLSGGNEAVTLAMMTASAAGEEFQAAKARGFSDDRAMKTALMSAGIEYLTEKIGLDVIMDKALPKESIRNYLLKSGAAEGGEEGLGDILNLALDWALDLIYETDESEFKQKVKEKEQSGMSHKEAQKETWGETLLDIGKDVAIGAVSGEMMAGPTAAYNAYANSKNTTDVGTQIKTEGQTKVQQTIDAGLKTDTSTAAHEQASEIQQQMQQASELEAQLDADIRDGKVKADGAQAKETQKKISELRDVSAKALGDLFMEIQKANESNAKASELVERAANEAMKNGSASKNTINEIAKNPEAYHMLDLKSDAQGKGDNLSKSQRKAAIDSTLRSMAEQMQKQSSQTTETNQQAKNRIAENAMNNNRVRAAETQQDRIARLSGEGTLTATVANNQTNTAQNTSERASQEATPQVMQAKNTNLRTGKTQNATFDGDPVHVTGIDHITPDGQVAVTLEDGRAVWLEDVDMGDIGAAQVYEASATLGNENAARTMISYYNGKNPVAYLGGFMQIYNAARSGSGMEQAIRNSLNASDLSQEQQQAAYFAGQNAAKADQESIQNKENSNGKESGNVSVSGSGKRASGQSAGERSGRVGERTGETEKRGSGSNRRGESLNRAINETSVRGEKITAESEGIKGGVSTSEARLVPEDVIKNTPELLNLQKEAEKNGITLRMFTGTMTVERNGHQFNVRGIHKGNTAWVKIDGAYEAQQIYRHEFTHHMIESDGSIIENLKMLLQSQMTEEQLSGVVNQYAQDHYSDGNGGITESEDYILEEMFADAYAGMNGFDQTNEDPDARQFTQIVSDTLSEVAEYFETVNQGENQNKGERFTIKKDIRNRPFVEIDRDILKGVPQSDWVKTVRNNLKSRFPKGITIRNEHIKINKQSRREITNSKESSKLMRTAFDIYSDKFKATDNLDEIIKATMNWVGEGPTHPRTDDIVEFARGNALMRIGQNDYEAEVLVATERNGALLIYDIVNMQPTTITERYSSTGHAHKELLSRHTVSSINNIAQSDQSVKRENTEARESFSLDDISDADVERVQRDNEHLQKTVDHLASQFKLIKGFHASDAMIDQLARGILKEYSSAYKMDTLKENLRTLLDYIADAEKPSWDDITKMGVGMAKEIINQSQALDKELYDSYTEARTMLKKTRIELTDVQRGEAAYLMGSYGNFRSKLFGSVNLVSSDGTSLDQAWKILSDMYPDLFDPNANEGDQVAGLYDAVQQMKPHYTNPYGMDIDGVAYDLFLNLFDKYFDMPDVKKAARDTAELARMQVASKKNLAMTHDQMKAAYERRLTDLRKESIARRQEAGKKYLEAKERGDKAAEEHYLKQYRYLQEQRSEKLLQQRAAYSVLSEYKSADRAQRIQREQLNKYRSRVESGAKQLSKWLQTPTEQNHIPEVMRNTVYDFLDSLDFSGKSDVKTKFWKDNLQAVKDYMARADAATVAGETEAYVDIDPDFADKVQKIMEYARGNMSIMDMDTEHLKLLNNIIDTLKTACRNVNTIIVNGRRQAIENFAVKAIEKAESIEMGENNRFTNSVAGELLTAGNIKPVYFFRHIGGPMQELFNEIRAGQTQYAFNLQKAKDYYDQVAEKYHAKDWLNKPGDTLKLQTERGRLAEQMPDEGIRKTAHEHTVELTRDEALALYAIWKRESSNKSTTEAKHLEYGGFVFDRDVKIEGKDGKQRTVRHGTPHPINGKDILKIKQWLTPEQIAYADELIKYMSTDMSALGNEVSMKMLGVKRFTEQNYFPYKSSHDFISSSPGKQANQSSRLMHKGFTKQTVAFANNPIVLQGFTEVFGKHVSDMLMYNAMAIPQENMIRVYNWAAGVDPNITSTSVKVALQNAYGKNAKNYVDTFLADLNGDMVSDPREQIGTKLLSKFKRASVMANLSVAIQQPSAIVRAAAVMDPKYFIGMPKRGSYAEAKKYAGTAIIKDVGGFDTATGRGAAQWITGLKSNKRVDRVMDVIDEAGGFMPEKMDEITWGAIWEACKRETADTTDLTGEDLLKAAGQRFDDVIELTQVYDSVITRSQLMRSKAGKVMEATSFMAEPTVTYNMIYDMLTNKDSDTKLHPARTMAAVVGATIFNTLLKSIVYAMRDKDDDETLLEKYVESVTGSLAGEQIENFGSLKWMGHLLTSEFSPATMIPYMRDVVSLLQGYSVNRSDLSVINDFAKALKVLNNDSKSAWEKFDAMTGAIGNITGVPYKNVSRDIQAIIRTASEILNNDQSVDPYGLIAAAYEGMQIEYTVKSNTEDACQAMLKGNNAKAERAAATIETFYKDQVAKELAKGKTQEEAEKDARTAVNKNVASVLGDYYMDAETAEERAKIRELAASITIGDVPAWINKAPGVAAQALYDAYESKDQTALQDALNELSALYDDHVVVYMKSGMSREEAEKKAKSDLKSNVTGILKPYYLEAETESEKVNIQQLALRITVAHTQLYNGYNFKSNWK